MKKQQIILVVSALAVVFALFYWGNMVPPAKKHNHAPATQTVAAPFDFEQLQTKAIAALDSTQQAAVKALQGKTDAASLATISAIWAKAKQGTISAKYKADLAKLENTEKSLTFASQYYIDLYNIEQDSATRFWQATQAQEMLAKVMQMNPTNEEAKVMLGKTYTDGTGETMKGVLMLKEVAEKNPSNLPAGVALGRLALQSGQFDKAITRLEALLGKHKNNTEAMYFLAEAYKGQGNITKAKELFTACKKLVNDQSFAKEIDDYIKTF
jgi:lipopolysaccharide biosynthesis regulator YciM